MPIFVLVCSRLVVVFFIRCSKVLVLSGGALQGCSALSQRGRYKPKECLLVWGWSAGGAVLLLNDRQIRGITTEVDCDMANF